MAAARRKLYLRPSGLDHNVEAAARDLGTIRAPLCFSETDADLFVAALDEVLAEDAVRGLSGTGS